MRGARHRLGRARRRRRLARALALLERRRARSRSASASSAHGGGASAAGHSARPSHGWSDEGHCSASAIWRTVASGTRSAGPRARLRASATSRSTRTQTVQIASPLARATRWYGFRIERYCRLSSTTTTSNGGAAPPLFARWVRAARAAAARRRRRRRRRWWRRRSRPSLGRKTRARHPARASEPRATIPDRIARRRAPPVDRAVDGRNKGATRARRRRPAPRGARWARR